MARGGAVTINCWCGVIIRALKWVWGCGVNNGVERRPPIRALRRPRQVPTTHSSGGAGFGGAPVSDFFGELGKRLGQRWLSLLAIPGMLLLAAAWIAGRLGQRSALDVHRLATAVGEAGAMISGWPFTTQALAVVGVLLVFVTVGFAVQALVGPVRAFCLGNWSGAFRHVERALTARRRVRWKKLVKERAALELLHPEQDRSPDQQRRIDGVANRINHIALAGPGRPTWMGDRIYALEHISVHRYGFDLAFGWPRLWVVLPDAVRAEINAAQGGFAAAVFTITWAVPYLLLGLLWWPAGLAGVAIAVVGWSRARDRLATLTELAESALDVHGRDLAIVLGVATLTSTGPLTPDEGQHITEIVRKGR